MRRAAGGRVPGHQPAAARAGACCWRSGARAARGRCAPDDGRCVPALPLEPAFLCAVGDRKQSIYEFRGADVSVFDAAGGQDRLRGRRARTSCAQPPLGAGAAGLLQPDLRRGAAWRATAAALRGGVRPGGGRPLRRSARELDRGARGGAAGARARRSPRRSARSTDAEAVARRAARDARSRAPARAWRTRTGSGCAPRAAATWPSSCARFTHARGVPAGADPRTGCRTGWCAAAASTARRRCWISPRCSRCWRTRRTRWRWRRCCARRWWGCRTRRCSRLAPAADGLTLAASQAADLGRCELAPRERDAAGALPGGAALAARASAIGSGCARCSRWRWR